MTENKKPETFFQGEYWNIKARLVVQAYKEKVMDEYTLAKDLATDDILCSAISAMTMLVINAIEVAYAADVDYVIDEETTNVRVSSCSALPEYEQDERKRYAISGLIMAYYYQLIDLVEEYYDYLDVEVVEKKFDGNKKRKI